MNEFPQDSREGFNVETGAINLFVTAYTGRLKITGTVQIALAGRSSDRRPSDLLRNFPDDYMTLRDAKIYKIDSGEVLEEQSFSLLNLKFVEAIYAEEVDE